MYRRLGEKYNLSETEVQRLSYQDLNDSRELAHFEEVFDMQKYVKKKQKGVADYD